MSLNDRQIKNAKPRDKDYKIADGEGLYLTITKAGSKLFRLKYRINGKEKKLSIGKYPTISLKNAREVAEEAKKLIANGVDPSSEKKANKEAIVKNNEDRFEVIANDWFDITQQDKAARTNQRTQSILALHILPIIGSIPIRDITSPALLELLRSIEQRGAFETTRRAAQIISQTYRFAIATSRVERDLIPDLRGALQPAVSKHFAAITEPKKAGELMASIDEFGGSFVVKIAIKLSALFFCRPGELRHLRWSDINEEDNRIEIVTNKTKQEHIIPICKQARALLEELRIHTGSGDNYIFPSARGKSRPMSENAVRVALRTMGYDNDTMTAHGFRAMARTLLDEVLGIRIDWIEQQLAHAVRDTNGRAYNRTRHIEQRTEMMQKWADYLDQLKAQALAKNVVTGNFKRA